MFTLERLFSTQYNTAFIDSSKGGELLESELGLTHLRSFLYANSTVAQSETNLNKVKSVKETDANLR